MAGKAKQSSQSAATPGILTLTYKHLKVMRFCIFLLLWMEFSVQGNWIPITKRRDGFERLVSEPQTQANYYYQNGKF